MISHRILFAVLLIFAAVALLFMLCDEGVISPGKTPHQERIVRILDLDAGDIYKFLFISGDSTLIEIEKGRKGWVIKQPIETGGSDYSIPNLVEALTSSITVEMIAGVDDLEKFGLADPRVTIIVFSEGSLSPDTIMVGDKAPTSAMCYAIRSSSKNVLLTNEITSDILDKTLFHFRDKKFVKLDVFKADRIGFSTSGRVFRIEKRAGDWFLEGTDFPVRKRFADDYLQSLNEALIYRFVSDDSSSFKSYGLDAPSYSIAIHVAEDSVRLSFGNRVSDMIMAAKSDVEGVFLVRSDILDIFNHPLPEYADLRLTTIEIKDISSISFASGPLEARLLRNQYGWVKIDSLGSGSVESESVKEIIVQLNSFRFGQFPLLDFEALYAEKTTKREITIRDKEDNILENIFFSTGPRGSILSGSLSTGAAGRVDKKKYLKLERLLEDL